MVGFWPEYGMILGIEKQATGGEAQTQLLGQLSRPPQMASGKLRLGGAMLK